MLKEYKYIYNLKIPRSISLSFWFSRCINYSGWVKIEPTSLFHRRQEVVLKPKWGLEEELPEKLFHTQNKKWKHRQKTQYKLNLNYFHYLSLPLCRHRHKQRINKNNEISKVISQKLSATSYYNPWKKKWLNSKFYFYQFCDRIFILDFIKFLLPSNIQLLCIYNLRNVKLKQKSFSSIAWKK